jgi:hypothetical protein
MAISATCFSFHCHIRFRSWRLVWKRLQAASPAAPLSCRLDSVPRTFFSLMAVQNECSLV